MAFTQKKRINSGEMYLAVLNGDYTSQSPIPILDNGALNPAYTRLFRDLSNDPVLNLEIGSQEINSGSFGLKQSLHSTELLRGSISVDIPIRKTYNDVAGFMNSDLGKSLQISFFDMTPTSGDTSNDGHFDGGETWVAPVSFVNKDLNCGRFGQIVIVDSATTFCMRDVKASFEIKGTTSDSEFPNIRFTYYGLVEKLDSTSSTGSDILGTDQTTASLIAPDDLITADLHQPNFTVIERVEAVKSISIDNVSVEDTIENITFNDNRNINFYQYVKGTNGVRGGYESSGYTPSISVSGFENDSFNLDLIDQTIMNAKDEIVIELGEELKLTIPQGQLTALPEFAEKDGFKQITKNYDCVRSSNSDENNFYLTLTI
jgi:hypothetical protein